MCREYLRILAYSSTVAVMKRVNQVFIKRFLKTANMIGYLPIYGM